MAEWLGQVIVLFPLWLGIPIIIVLGFAWFLTFLWQKSPRYEWPDDKKKRLAREELKRNAKILKAKKG